MAEEISTPTGMAEASAADDTPRENLQANYQPEPFLESSYECIGEAIDDTDFFPDEFPVIQTQVEEVVSIFPQFDAGVQRTSTRRVHSASGEMTDESEEETAGVDEEEMMRKLEQRLEEGKKVGYEKGYAEAKSEVTEHYAELTSHLEVIRDTILQEFQVVLVRIEKESVRLALEVAKKILITTAEVKPEYIFQVIQAGLKALSGTNALRIRLSPEDMEFINIVGEPPEISAEELGVQYIADESVKSGCIIETDFGELDLQLEKMWEQVKTDLYEVYK